MMRSSGSSELPPCVWIRSGLRSRRAKLHDGLITHASRGVFRPSSDICAKSPEFLGLPHPAPSTLDPWIDLAVSPGPRRFTPFRTEPAVFMQAPLVGFKKIPHIRRTQAGSPSKSFLVLELGWAVGVGCVEGHSPNNPTRSSYLGSGPTAHTYSSKQPEPPGNLSHRPPRSEATTVHSPRSRTQTQNHRVHAVPSLAMPIVADTQRRPPTPAPEALPKQ